MYAQKLQIKKKSSSFFMYISKTAIIYLGFQLCTWHWATGGKIKTDFEIHKKWKLLCKVPLIFVKVNEWRYYKFMVLKKLKEGFKYEKKY